jgi:hypothetical protein
LFGAGGGCGGEGFGAFGGRVEHASAPGELAFIGFDGAIGFEVEAIDPAAAFVEGEGERGFDVPGVDAAAVVAVAESDGVFQVAVGEGIELFGPEFVEEVLGVELAEAGVVLKFGGAVDGEGGDALLPYGRDDVFAGVQVVFAGVLRRAGLALGRAGAGGFLRVGAVGGEAPFGHTDEGHGANSRTECSRGEQGNRGVLDCKWLKLWEIFWWGACDSRFLGAAFGVDLGETIETGLGFRRYWACG